LKKARDELASLAKEAAAKADEAAQAGRRVQDAEAALKKARDELAEQKRLVAARETDAAAEAARRAQEAEAAQKKLRDELAQQKRSMAALEEQTAAAARDLTAQRDKLSSEVAALRRELADAHDKHVSTLDATEGSLKREVASLRKDLAAAKDALAAAVDDHEAAARAAAAAAAALRTQLADQKSAAEKRQEEMQAVSCSPRHFTPRTRILSHGFCCTYARLMIQALDDEAAQARAARVELADGKRVAPKRITELQEESDERRRRAEELEAWKATATDTIAGLRREIDSAKVHYVLWLGAIRYPTSHPYMFECTCGGQDGNRQQLDAAAAATKRAQDEAAARQRDLAEMTQALAGCEKVISDMEAQKKQDDAALAAARREGADAAAALAAAERRVADLVADGKALRSEVDRLTRALEVRDTSHGASSSSCVNGSDITTSIAPQEANDRQLDSDRVVTEAHNALKKAAMEAQQLRQRLDEDTDALTQRLREAHADLEKRKVRPRLPLSPLLASYRLLTLPVDRRCVARRFARRTCSSSATTWRRRRTPWRSASSTSKRACSSAPTPRTSCACRRRRWTPPRRTR
jgi:chromosome segregation ATPase